MAPPQRWSLSALVARVLQRQLPKPPDVRKGAWDARVLSHEQESYAALDAWASLRLHQVLSVMPLLPLPEAPPPLFLEQQAGCTAAVVVPAVAAPAPLTHAKREVLAMHASGMSVAHIANARGIKPVTVENYLTEAIVAGYGYQWHLLGVPDVALSLVEAALASAPAAAVVPGAATSAVPTAPPAAAAPDPDAALRSKMKELKARLPEWVSFSMIRLVLVHRDRTGASAAPGAPPP